MIVGRRRVWIGIIYGITTLSGTTAPVVVSDGGQLGTLASSERFKNSFPAAYRRPLYIRIDGVC
jgi:hypothetical protein